MHGSYNFASQVSESYWAAFKRFIGWDPEVATPNPKDIFKKQVRQRRVEIDNFFANIDRFPTLETKLKTIDDAITTLDKESIPEDKLIPNQVLRAALLSKKNELEASTILTETKKIKKNTEKKDSACQYPIMHTADCIDTLLAGRGNQPEYYTENIYLRALDQFIITLYIRDFYGFIFSSTSTLKESTRNTKFLSSCIELLKNDSGLENKIHSQKSTSFVFEKEPTLRSTLYTILKKERMLKLTKAILTQEIIDIERLRIKAAKNILFRSRNQNNNYRRALSNQISTKRKEIVDIGVALEDFAWGPTASSYGLELLKYVAYKSVLLNLQAALAIAPIKDDLIQKSDVRMLNWFACPIDDYIGDSHYL